MSDVRLTADEREALSKMLWDTTLDELTAVVEGILAARLTALLNDIDRAIDHPGPPPWNDWTRGVDAALDRCLRIIRNRRAALGPEAPRTERTP